MHLEAKHFMDFVKSAFPAFFENVRALDVGSGDINGNNKYLFSATSHYTGNDVVEGRNIDIVCKTSSLPFGDETFDTIVSTECFEHDPEWNLSLVKIVKMLKPGGLFAMTCASTGRGEHGTRRTSPQDCLATSGGVEEWQDHYRNLEASDLNDAVNLKDTFSDFRAYYNANSKDLYFWGIKKRRAEYEAPYCVRTA